MKVEKYWNEKDEMAVLVSPGWGAGWSTWGNYPEIAYDKRIIEAFLNHYNCDEIEKYCKELGYEDVYASSSSWGNCEIEWIPRGTIFYINDYDGAERLITSDAMQVADD